jgi:hypothetical protein
MSPALTAEENGSFSNPGRTIVSFFFMFLELLQELYAE